MIFFSIFRIFGFTYFQVTEPPIEFSPFTDDIIRNAFWIFEGVFILKILTNISWKSAIGVVGVTQSRLFLLAEHAQHLMLYFDLLFYIGLPLFINIIDKNKFGSIKFVALKSIVFSIALIAFSELYIYLTIFFARGYPTYAKYDSVWLSVVVIDYFLLLPVIYKNKGLIFNGFSRFKTFIKQKYQIFRTNAENRKQNH